MFTIVTQILNMSFVLILPGW